RTWKRKTRLSAIGAGIAVLAVVAATGQAWAGGGHPAPSHQQPSFTLTPIKHAVVIFDENVSFDHYFGTYPHAANTDGTPLKAAPHTPAIDGLTPALLNNNPNLFNPQRLTHSQAMTCDQDHGYNHEQLAENGGAADQFVQHTDHDTCTGQPILFGAPGLG